MRCQSIVNILLYREFGAVVWKKKVKRPAATCKLHGTVWTIQRFVTHMFKGNLCQLLDLTLLDRFTELLDETIAKAIMAVKYFFL